MIAALLIGGAALAHATWNIAMKRAGTSGTPFIAATLLVGVIALAPFGVVSLATEPPAQDGWYVVALVAGSATLQLAYFLLLQRGHRLADVGVVYPVARGVGPLLSVIAAYTLWDAAAVTLAGLAPVGYYWASMVVQLLVLGAIALRTPATAAATARAHPMAAVVVGVLSSLAYIAVLFAYQLAPVAIVAPAREVSVVLIALAGWMLFREPHPMRRILGSIVVIGGVALLALG